MKKLSITSVLELAFLPSLCLPLIASKSPHDCRYDECYHIFYNGKFGMCVERAVDNMFFLMAILWLFTMYGALIIWNKRKDAVSPFAVTGFIIVLSVCGAIVDPSKWSFVVALIPSLGILITGFIIDSRNPKTEK